MPYKEIEPKVGGGHSFTTLVYPTSKCLKNEGVKWSSSTKLSGTCNSFWVDCWLSLTYSVGVLRSGGGGLKSIPFLSCVFGVDVSFVVTTELPEGE